VSDSNRWITPPSRINAGILVPNGGRFVSETLIGNALEELETLYEASFLQIPEFQAEFDYAWPITWPAPSPLYLASV